MVDMDVDLQQEVAIGKNQAATSIKYLFTGMVFFLWAFVVANALWRPFHSSQFGATVLGLCVIVYVLNELASAVEGADIFDTALLTGCLIVTAVITLYMFFNYELVHITRSGYATSTEYILALGFIPVIVYLSYRSFGPTFLSVFLFVLGYAYFGPYFPGIFSHTGVPERRLLQLMVLEFEGFYGNLTVLVAEWISLFLLFAGMMIAYGTFSVILHLTSKLSNYVSSGFAQIAVITSMIMGSINGSATANAGITGSVTIPMMKENGLTSEAAAGIESVASNGGQITPPIMGATAFLMASILNRPFYEILIAAVVPVLIYYVSVALAVHYTVKQQLGDKEDHAASVAQALEKVKDVSLGTPLDAIRFVTPVVVLLYFLAIAQYTIQTSALYAVASIFVTGIAVPVLHHRSWNALATQTRNTLEGAKDGALLLAPIAIIVAVLNAIVDIIMVTGFPGKFALALMDLSGGVMLVAIILSMVLCIVLGLGMPGIAAYLIVAIIVAPQLINQFGLPELPVHFLVFYAANLSTITPPIAAGVVVAAGIAKAKFWATAYQAITISAPIFILPLSFAYHPEIVNSTISVRMVASAVIICIGALSLIHGLNFPFAGRNKRSELPLRAIFAVGGILVMAHPSTIFQLSVAAVILVVAAVVHHETRGRVITSLSQIT